MATLFLHLGVTSEHVRLSPDAILAVADTLSHTAVVSKVELVILLRPCRS